MNIFETKNLIVGYGKKSVVENADISVAVGEIACFIGANGSGKSTLLKAFAGLNPALSGEIFIDGKKFLSIARSELARTVSVMLTDNLNCADMTSYELVSTGRIPFTDFLGNLTDADREIIDAALVKVGGEELRNRSIYALSDGERQKIFLARAIAQQPKILILDEPLSHLDINRKIEFIRILRELANNKTAVILSLHDISLAEKFCDKAYLVSEKKVCGGTTKSVIFRENIRKIYGISENDFNEFFA